MLDDFIRRYPLDWIEFEHPKQEVHEFGIAIKTKAIVFLERLLKLQITAL
jgi:hypothetical protein